MRDPFVEETVSVSQHFSNHSYFYKRSVVDS